jgi:hypothetical protein
VAAAVAVPVAVLRPDSGVTTQVGAPPPATVPAPTGLSVALRFHATWLPSGVAEHVRVGALADMGPGHIDGVYSVYSKLPVDATGNDSGPRLTVQVRKAASASDPEINDGSPITVNGKPGFYHGKGDTKSYIEWRADADWVVSVDQNGLGLTQAELLRVADSVRADPGGFDIPLRFGWLPDGINPQFVTFAGNSAAAWIMRVSGEQAQTGTKETNKQNRSLDVELGTATSAPAGGTAVQVGGKTGRLVTRTVDGANVINYLVVDLGGGRVLTIVGQGGIANEDLVKVAQNTQVTGDPDLTWLGR